EGAWFNSGWTYGSTAATDNTADEVDTYLGRTVVGSTTHDPVDYARPQTSLVVPSSSNPLSRDFIALRPADYDYSQHRSIEFKPFDHQVTEPLWTAAQDKYGVQVRGYFVGGYVATALVAYLEPIFTETASTLDQTSLVCHLAVKVRNGIDTDPTYLGLLSKTMAGVDLADGAFHTLDYNCHVFEDATSVDGPVVHTVTVDGSVVVFDTVGTYGSGLQVLADGRVLDTGAFGPGSAGNVEGFFFESTVPTTDNSSNVLREPAQVKEWTQGALTLLDPTLPPELMPSFAWTSDEGFSEATGDLGDVMDAVFPVSVTHQGTDPIELETEIGLRFTRARATRTRRRWRFSGAPLSSSARDTMEAFWGSHGVGVAFNWTPDGESAVVAYFVSPPVYKMVSPDAWVPTVEIEEVLA
ncbi:MAG: hypothetical protein GY884_19920, partial [Proteobacteria bacterium]|nr:hypothetical protein [Pseudomonadota bacterium]